MRSCTKADANLWLSETEADLARGTWTDPKAGRVSFEHYAHGWLETRLNLRPRSVDLYESLLKRHIIPYSASVRSATSARPPLGGGTRTWCDAAARARSRRRSATGCCERSSTPRVSTG